MARKRRGLSTAESGLADFYAGMDDDQLECKVSGRHRLPRVTDPRKTTFRRQKSGVYQQVAKCEWCGTTVTKVIAPSGYLDDIAGHPSYDHPEGYLVPKDFRGVGRREGKAIARREARLRNQGRDRDLAEARKKTKAAARRKTASAGFSAAAPRRGPSS